MALTRNFLKSMGLTDEQVNAIIENHAETVEGLKKERDDYKAEAEKVAGLTSQLAEANQKLENSGDAAKVQQAFDDYKASVEAEKATVKKRTAMDAVLKDKVGIARDSARKLIIDAMNLTPYELGDDGQLKNEDSIVTDMKTRHAEWIGEVKTDGVNTLTPPSGGGAAKMTKDDIYKITDPAKLRAAIADNIELFK